VVGSSLDDLVGVDETGILAFENISLGLLVDRFVTNIENVIGSESLLALGIEGFHGCKTESIGLSGSGLRGTVESCQVQWIS
jgi:hypothetical protein